ncbi:MAG: FAD-dependent oxidoreductase [Deltaproteobacteria bacterium]|nr:FAD-dependent oxidoreductase [Deltaproteobacteria bacterium]
MDFLRPENLLRYGYKDCVLCEVERKGEEKRCRRCSGRVNQRDRLLWEINRARIRRVAAKLSLVCPGLGHIYGGRVLLGIFWAILIPLSLGFVINVWTGPTFGHAFLLGGFGFIWFLAWLDAGRGFEEKLSPCQEACPSHIQVPDYIALVREGRSIEALALVHDRLPFAAFCGRACPHPCEQKCVRSEFGAPISIMAIKRYAADIGYAEGIEPSTEIDAGSTGPRVAVIGAGAAGLSAANTLARLGCRVTVFDRNEEPGGMMRYAVADFRFSREALLDDVRTILARGVRFAGGKTLGRDFTLENLADEGYEAVLVSVGTGEALRLPGAGTEEEGFHDALSFLARISRGGAVRLHGRVVVIGGGNVAVDVSRVAIRLGAEDVTIACLESRGTMPAFSWEVEEAEAEGVKLLPSVAVKKFLVRDGRVAGFEALQVERIEFDAKGRIVPHTVLGSEYEVRADTIIMAIGSRAEWDHVPEVAGRKPVDPGHHVFRLIFENSRLKIPAYACGDCIRGPGTVVEASASGRAAALNIFEHLRVQEVRSARFEDNYRRRTEPQVEDRPEWRQRRHPERLSPEESRRTFREVERRLTDQDAHHEAERCARCNLSL